MIRIIQKDDPLNMFAKCFLIILELNWHQQFGKNESLSSRLSSSTQLQDGLFHVVDRTRTFAKCTKIKIAHAKRAKLLLFNC